MGRPARAATGAAGGGRGGSLEEKILIVEDDVDMAEACRRIFRKAGFEADAVYGAQEGLDVLAKDSS